MENTEKDTVCPLADVCDKQVLWNRPVWVMGKLVDHIKVKQGHCIPHKEMATCKTHSCKCPACVKL